MKNKIKLKEFRDLSIEALESKINECKIELFNLRFQGCLNQLTNPMRLKVLKKDIARAHTVKGEKIKNAAVEV
ncbi:MAG: 50S ribosomal protein L29 [Candidatus Improbicoccus devescovinae]|nr:MAG: 50S ribosomal protein L29 [Candidatus Improbicoccus devescovinae]